MKVVWAHDHYFIKDKSSEKVYSEIEFPYENWYRYLDSFENLTILSREKVLNDQNVNRMNLSSGENVEFIGIGNINTPLNVLLKRRTSIKSIRKALYDSDALIARLPSTIGIMAIREAKKLNKPYAIEMVGCPHDALKGLKSLKAKIYEPFLTYMTKKAVEHSPYVLYVTKGFLQKRYPTTGKSVACSNVKLKYINKSNLIIPKGNIIYSNQETIKIGLIGYLSKYKGIDTALKAIKELSNKYPNIELEILGNGDKEFWRKEAEAFGLESNRFSMKVLANPEDVLSWLDKLHIYIQPSRTEGLPRGLIEAMSRGCPCVASTVGGIPELLDTEFLHAPEDYKTLGKIIDNILNNELKFKQMSEKNYSIAMEYSFELLENRRIEFWKEFASHVRENG